MDYPTFLQSKLVRHKPSGFNVQMSKINPLLFQWQRDVVQWALALGKAALFEERGLGKTLQQVEWAKQVANHTGGKVLIVCPLAVARQTIKEAAKIDVPVTYVRSMEQAKQAGPIVITNYDMVKEFDLNYFAGLVLDESSILKNYTGSTKRFLIENSTNVRYKLACTATPAPNDYLELGNHAEWLGVMKSNEMISRWFINDTMEAGGYRLKNYAAQDFYRWITSWAVFISTPADLNYPADDYILPELSIEYHKVEVDHSRAWSQTDNNGQARLILDTAPSATGMWAEKRETSIDRVKIAVDLVLSEPAETHIVWCDTNEESALLAKMIPGAMEVRGSDSVAEKERKIEAFTTGAARVIITKSTITGMGMNWQHCARNTFVSTNYKWEEWYQAIGRTHRYGQKRPVTVNMIYSETEQNIIAALDRKGKQHKEMQGAIAKMLRKSGLQLQVRRDVNTDIGTMKIRLPEWIGA